MAYINNASKDISTARLESEDGTECLHISGHWTLHQYSQLEQTIAALPRLNNLTRIEIAGLQQLDTAGASLLVDLVGPERLAELAQVSNISQERRMLLQLVGNAMSGFHTEVPEREGNFLLVVLERMGRSIARIGQNLLGLLGFLGVTLVTLFRCAFHIRRWRVTSLVAQLEQTCFDAVPIVALLTFLVGAVIAFLGATVLERFGASIYTVYLLAYAFLREFNVLLAAILVAGRTASAFTAQIGSMKANQELDAIRALGMNPIELLVLPRALALLISLPLLTFIATIAGLIGGGLVCVLTQDISPTTFLGLLKSGIPPHYMFVGLVKAPFFAFIIALIGCLEGFKVSGSAASVGEHTTSSVVQSIFIVILLDAVAALFYMEIGW